MDIYRYFICFILYGIAGWMYESAYYTLRYRRPVNTGFLNGCFCPIYGIGAVLIIIILGRIESLPMLFAAGMFLTCTLEYIVSWALEEVFHERWWDYSSWPFNINGRVCLTAGLAFGVMTVLLVKIIHPAVISYISQLSGRAVMFWCIIAAAALVTDIVMTMRHADSFEKKLWFVDMGPGVFRDFGHDDCSGGRSRNGIIRRVKEYMEK